MKNTRLDTQNILSAEERERKCFDTAVKYLSASSRSEKEVKEKLYQKGFHRNEVEFALEKCKGYRYIDDASYTRSFVEYYGDKFGKKMLIYKLTTDKGVDATLVANTVEDMISDDAEREKCLRIAQKYVAQKRIVSRQDFVKVGQYLYSKGFEWGVINFALDHVDLPEIEG